LLLVLLIASVGCRDAVGPERFHTAPATGQVLLAGRPIPGGFLEFAPVEGTVGLLRSTEIGPDGRFAVDRLPVGTVGIRLVGSRLPPTGNPRTDRFVLDLRQRYAITRTIPPTGARLTIDLAEEAARFVAP
jgi:hypothetical protein